MYRYRINQFVVESEIPLPCDTRYAAVDDAPDDAAAGIVRVRVADHPPCEFPDVRYIHRQHGGALRMYDVGDGVLMQVWPDTSLHVDRGGETITVATPSGDLLLAALFVIGNGLGVCGLRRGWLPLHAACGEIDGRVYALSAASGTGKSTTQWALLEQGARFFVDDVVHTRCENGESIAWPSMSLHPKVGRGLLELRGLSPERFEATYPGEDKFWAPIAPERRVRQPRRLSALFLLQPEETAETADRVIVERVRGTNAVQALLGNTYGLWGSCTGSADSQRIFLHYLSLVQSVPILRLRYRKRFSTLPDLVAAIREQLAATAERRIVSKETEVISRA